MREIFGRLINFFQFLFCLVMVAFLLINVLFGGFGIIDNTVQELGIPTILGIMFLFILLLFFSTICVGADGTKVVKIFSCFNVFLILSICYMFKFDLNTVYWVIAIIFVVANFFNGWFYKVSEYRTGK